MLIGLKKWGCFALQIAFLTLGSLIKFIGWLSTVPGQLLFWVSRAFVRAGDHFGELSQ